MATSGSTDYDLNALAIIEHALRLVGVLGDTESASSDQQTYGLIALNLLTKTDQMKLGLWRRQRAKLFLVNGQAEYSLPGANVADIDEIAETTLDAAEASGQTVLSVTSTSGFTVADVIGVVLDDNTIHWSTIASFVTDDTVTIDDATTAAAASGNKVFVYTNALVRPLKITHMQSEESSSEVVMESLSHGQYVALPNKAAAGRPVNFYFDPQQTTAKLYLWPAPNDVDVEINFSCLMPLEDFDATTDTSNYPQEWLEYLCYNLAIRLAARYGVQAPNEVAVVAAQTKNDLMGWDNEESDIQFGVAYA